MRREYTTSNQLLFFFFFAKTNQLLLGLELSLMRDGRLVWPSQHMKCELATFRSQLTRDNIDHHPPIEHWASLSRCKTHRGRLWVTNSVPNYFSPGLDIYQLHVFTNRIGQVYVRGVKPWASDENAVTCRGVTAGGEGGEGSLVPVGAYFCFDFPRIGWIRSLR